jgi:hypothetical protein
MFKKRIIFSLIILSVILGACSVQKNANTATDVSNLSINHMKFIEPVSENFMFFVYGHSYGTALEADEYPSITLRNSLEPLLAMGPKMVFSLGDMVEDPTEQQFADMNALLLSRYDIPVFNSVGNHDVKNRELYESLFGQKTYYSFQYANAMFVVLDTEINSCYIEGDQLAMLESALDTALADDSIDTIFIMMHKVLFFDSYLMRENESNMVRTNDLKIFEGNNFSEITDSLLVPAAKKKPVHIFAGDVGAFNGNLSPYYQKDNRGNLYMYASGLGDSENDVILIVNNSGDKVTVSPYVLATGETLNIQDFDETYWRYYGKDRWEKYRPALDFSQACVLDVCRVGKDVFHMQCRYFLLLIAAISAGVIYGIFRWIRKKKQQAKA